MRHKHITLPLALGLSAALAGAQDSVATQSQKGADTSTNFHRDGELRGMDLWSSQDAEGDREDLGDINDFIINARSGAISHYVISSGGVGSLGDTLRALPWDQVEWSKNSDGERMAFVRMTEDKFRALPGFDEKNIDKLVGAQAVEANAQRLRDAKDNLDIEDARAAARGAQQASGMAASNHLCSTITGLDIYGPGEKDAFSSIESLVFDCDNAAVAFVTMEANDETYLVPFSLLSIRPLEAVEDPKDIEYVAWAPKNEVGMNGAPSVDEDKKRTAQNPRFRSEVYTHYDMKGPSYALKAAQKGADRVSEVIKRSNG